MILNKHTHVKVVLTLDERHRLTHFFDLLVTIERRRLQPRDNKGRFTTWKRPKPSKKTKGSIARLAIKRGPF